MQDAFHRLLERWPAVQGAGNLEGYLYRTAMNVYRSRLRRAAVALRKAVGHLPVDDQLVEVEARDAVAMVLFVAAVGGALFALRGVWAGHRQVPSSGWTPERALEIQPGQYFYLKGTDYGFDRSINAQQTWWAPDGSGELRFDTNRPDKYVPYPPVGVYRKGTFPLPYQDDLSSLSTDPGVLEGQVRERADRGGESEWRTILNLLDVERSPEALPELRAALFEVAAGLDGVTRQDGVLDPVGRGAVALRADEVAQGVDDSGETTSSTMHWELFFDPGTHQLMAEAVGFEAQPVPFEILESAIVDIRGAAPTDDQLLFPRPTYRFEPPPQASPSSP